MWVEYQPGEETQVDFGLVGRTGGWFLGAPFSNLRPELLILDDFGLKPLQKPGPEDLYDVINERYEWGQHLVDFQPRSC